MPCTILNIIGMNLFLQMTSSMRRWIIMEIPFCCNQKMKCALEGLEIIEMVCERCGETIYLKKEQSQKPELLDD
ncbi:MAG: hypothetical protein HY832_03480 [Candidatus Aenigmarchaeota archaeon]|nr:hypothetical protein [Candidatus Aenigmarchaeota archaeon]